MSFERKLESGDQQGRAESAPVRVGIETDNEHAKTARFERTGGDRSC